LDSSLLLKSSVGKLVIKTYFTTNPFIIPIQCLTHTLQVEKMIKVLIADDGGDGEDVVSSAEFVGMECYSEVDKDSYVASSN
jgi:hypothetical protein